MKNETALFPRNQDDFCLAHMILCPLAAYFVLHLTPVPVSIHHAPVHCLPAPSQANPKEVLLYLQLQLYNEILTFFSRNFSPEPFPLQPKGFS